MKEVCNGCGKLKEVIFFWKKGGWDNYVIKYCYECGTKLEALMKKEAEKK